MPGKVDDLRGTHVCSRNYARRSQFRNQPANFLEQSFRHRYLGHWKDIAAVADVGFWQLAAGKPASSPQNERTVFLNSANSLRLLGAPVGGRASALPDACEIQQRRSLSLGRRTPSRQLSPFVNRDLTVDLSARYRLPAIYDLLFMPGPAGWFLTGSIRSTSFGKGQRMSIASSRAPSLPICPCRWFDSISRACGLPCFSNPLRPGSRS
jgi:hypothetical protein